MIWIEDRTAGRNNNFNLVRMIAASGVLLSHAWPLALGNGVVEPLYAETGYKLGTTCVTIFFAISGFFITKSFENRVSVADFALARIARIYPALLVVLLLTVALLGPIFTSLGIWHYLGDRHTWTYVPRNLSLKLLQWQLPGVFLDNPYGGAINGSLWTLYPEVSCYLLVVLAGLTRLTTRPAFPLVLAAVIAAIFLARQSEGGDLVHSAATLGFPFALGAGAYIYRRFIPVSGLLALALVAGAVLLRTTTLYPLMHALALSYAALWCGFVRIPGLHAYNRLGDYSYGMYIYAFPVEQMVMALHRPLAPIQLALFSFPITALFAYLSWTWVEAPALAHRHTIGARLRLRRMR